MALFQKKRTVYFKDTDAAGIVYFARYFNFAHETLEDYLISNGVSLPDILKEGRELWPITRSECIYKSPARLNDVLEISLALAANGESGMQSIYTIVNTNTGKETATVTIEHTFIAAIDWTKIALPPVITKLLEE